MTSVFSFLITKNFSDEMLYTYHSLSELHFYRSKKCAPSIMPSCKNKQCWRERRRMRYVSVAIELRRGRLSPRGLTKTIMYKGVRKLSIDTAKQCFDYDVTNDRLLIGYMVAQRHGQLSAIVGNRSFWHNAHDMSLLSTLVTRCLYCKSCKIFYYTSNIRI